MPEKKKDAKKTECIPGYNDLLADLVGMIKETMKSTRSMVDEKTFISMWGIKKKKSRKKKRREYQEI